MASSAIKVLCVVLVVFAVGAAARPERTLLQNGCLSVLNNAFQGSNVASGNCIDVSNVAVPVLSAVLGQQVQGAYRCNAEPQAAPSSPSGSDNCKCSLLPISGVTVPILSVLNLLSPTGNQVIYTCN